MNYPELFSELKNEFSDDIALGVCVALGIHISTKITEKDITKPGRYGQKVTKKIRNALWEYSSDDVDLIIRIEAMVYEWDTRRSMDGFGGCVRKTFRELIEE